MNADVGHCVNDDCTFNTDGACVEDQDPATCRFRRGRPMLTAETVAPPDGQGEAEPEIEGVALALGQRLQAAECRHLRERTNTRVISILAPKGAGKTSLIAGLYELFLEGRAVDVSFAGSDTLLEFERICHLSRAESGRIVPDMERTQRALGLGYYHLLLKVRDRRLGLLLGDRPGETISEAANGGAAAGPLQEIRSADCLLYLIDGGQLANSETRNLPATQAEAVLEGLLAAGHLAHQPPLGVVLTKADLVSGSGQLARFEAAFGSLATRFARRFTEIRPFETAANPLQEIEGVSRGHGMNALLDFLTGARGATWQQVRTPAQPTRQFSRFGRGKPRP